MRIMILVRSLNLMVSRVKRMKLIYSVAVQPPFPLYIASNSYPTGHPVDPSCSYLSPNSKCATVGDLRALIIFHHSGCPELPDLDSLHFPFPRSRKGLHMHGPFYILMANQLIVIFLLLDHVRNIGTSEKSHDLVLPHRFSRSSA